MKIFPHEKASKIRISALPPHRKPPGGIVRPERGASLVIILAFVVLLTVLVLAYFSYSSLQGRISQASVNQAAAELFARGAVNTLIGDLRQEIRAGSTNIATNAAHPVYYPTSPSTMVPAISGFTTNTGLENLLKVSRGGVPFFSGTHFDAPAFPPATRASGISTATASQNGRVFSLDRWNAPLLLAKANTNSATDLTPTNTFAAPDWIYVARDGSNPTTWTNNLRWNPSNATTVVGRYAYAIYDEGGLLDMNAAGFPPGSPTNLIADKGSLATADLSVIPGMTTNAIAAVVGWRNRVTAGSAGGFPNYTFTPAGQTNYFDFARTNTSGFLRTANSSLSGGQSDRMFVSRQQLIQFLTQGVAATPAEKAALQNALRYLGTFSRDLEQPSFRPDPDRPKNTTHDWASSVNPAAGFGGNDAYDPSGARQDMINPALLTVRNSDDALVTKRRFPLSRLALLVPDPSPQDAAKILEYFGLTWNNSSKRWDYDHGQPNQILKLSEIPANREPDFFETLKAVIHCDSLGKQYGGNDYSDSSNPSPHNYLNGAAAVDGVVNYQILQIGANLIDQYDGDSYPTAIALTPLRVFYGVENLPYLAGWKHSWYRMKHLTAADIDPANQPPAGPNGSSVYPYETWTMFQPILWNPHAWDPNLDPAKTPTNFRVKAGSMSGIAVVVNPLLRPSWWQSGPVSQYPAAGGWTPVSWAQSILNPATSTITFSAAPNTAPNVPASFQEPYRLLYNFPAGSDANAGEPQGRFSLDALGSIADPVLAASDAAYDGKTIIGFFGGKCWTGPWNALSDKAGSEPANCLSSGYSSTNDLQMTLEYQDPSGDWLPYDVISQVYASTVQNSLMSTVDNADSGTQIRGFLTGLRTDPRTNRWGLFTIKTFPLASNPVGTASPPDNNIHKGSNANYGIYAFPQGTTLSSTAGDNSGFIMRLNRNAAGNPLVEWRTTIFPSDLMVNANTGSTSSPIPGGKFYYNDPDHVIRRASGAFFSSGDGLPMRTGNFTSRPVILNRPFRSVAEMGYAFSGTPWKDINFLAAESGDAALLDAFCLHETKGAPDDVLVAGRTNLNTRQSKVIEALILGAGKAEGGTLSAAEAANAARALVDWTTADPSLTANLTGGVFNKGPLRNRGELVGKFVSSIAYPPPPSSNIPNIGVDGSRSYSGFSSTLTTSVFSTPADASVKRRRESVIRALADSGNTRTWNLFIDLLAQTGRFPQRAEGLSQFTVEGETRFWIHLAVDRFTGDVVASQFEQISE